MLYRVSSVYIITEHVFALASLLGFRFAPRVSDALSKKLYLADDLDVSGSLSELIFDQVNKKLIIEQWDEMRRVASSIRHGTVSASLLMRKLAAYPRQNHVARALTELCQGQLTFDPFRQLEMDPPIQCCEIERVFLAANLQRRASPQQWQRKVYHQRAVVSRSFRFSPLS